jgi:tRNA uridine 5-carboxymethylaminomethyl modification enzyme
MFNGRIQGLGPRYCPSIEDKINRFADKDSHQLFVEPEGWDTVEVYVNGFSTSLPEDVQMRALRSVPGFAQAKFFRPGYAVEYDFFHPTQLRHTLETQGIQGLYFAGQINGTTGYEEAAAQGLMAGINAARSTWNKEPVVLGRNQAYIGVLIDDLVTKGTKEPYRMFTSRAEYRILLRQDNADERLTPLAAEMGLASPERIQRFENRQETIHQWTQLLHKTSIDPACIQPTLDVLGEPTMKQKTKAHLMLLRPAIELKHLIDAQPELNAMQATLPLDAPTLESVEIKIKYAGYIEKEQSMADKLQRLDDITIPEDFAFQSLQSLSAESREKLTQQKPRTLGHASKISGVSQSDLAVLLITFGR